MVSVLSLLPSLLLLAPDCASAFSSTPAVFASTKSSLSVRSAGLDSVLFAANNADNVSDNDAAAQPASSRRSFLTFLAVPILFPAVASARTSFGPVTSGGLVFGSDDIMDQKEHGTSSSPVQDDLKYGVSQKLADRICNYNRHFAELGGSWEGTSFEKEVRKMVATTGGPVTFYDSVTGKPLFRAPVDRSVDDFLSESHIHGWPSFRDSEVVWSDVRVLSSSGETVSEAGTHLGHNLPDGSGNRYCINLVSIAGNPTSGA